MKLYIAGRITGVKDLNFPAFHRAAAHLRGLGHQVVNPAEINPDHSKPWAECMKTDIQHLVSCDGLALLPGWGRSRGARLEHHIASELGLQIQHIEASVLELDAL